MKRFENKKLLLLAGQGVHNKVVEAAKKNGIHVTVCDNIVDSPAKLLADDSLMFSVDSVDEIEEWCADNKIDSVMNFCNDFSQMPCQVICEKLKKPYYGSKEQVSIFTNKTLFKKTLTENGLSIIPSYSIKELESGCVEFPLLIKPADSRGSRGLTVCYSKDDAVKAVSIALSESKSNSIVIEKYMSGKQDFTVTYYINDGEPFLVQLGDRYLGRKDDNLDRQAICQFSPSYLTDIYLEKTDALMRKMFKNIGLKNGPVFMQAFFDNGIFRFYDPGMRFPGTEYERAVEKATGFDIIFHTIKYCLEGHNEGSIPNNLFRLNNKFCIQLFIDVGPGKVSRIEGLEEIEKYDEIVYIAQKIKLNEIVYPTGNVKQRIFEILILIDKDHQHIVDFIKHIQLRLKVYDEYGNNMIVSPLSTSVVNNYFQSKDN